MKMRKLGVAGLVSALVVGLGGLTASSAAAVDDVQGVTGSVTYANKPVDGAFVYAYKANGEFASSTMTDAAGKYSISLPAGSYRVQVSNYLLSGPAEFLETYAGGTVRSPDATLVKVASGKAVTANIKPVAGATVRGKVVDSKNRPVKGAYVSASNNTRAGFASATTDAKGNYELRGLATGKVTVWAGHKNANGTVTATAKQGSSKKAKTVKIKSAKQGTITATVKNLKVGDTIWLYDTKAKYSFQIATAEKKTVKIKQKIAPGTYRVVVGGTNKASKAVTVRAKKTAKAGTLKAPSKRTKIYGTVKGSNGKVLAGATVWASDSYGTWFGSAVSSKKGKYTITGAVSGKYTVSVVDNKAKNAETSKSVTVKKGKKAKKNVKMRKGYTITGTVKYKSKPVAGVDVRADYGQMSTTSSKGKFKLTGIGKGKVFLSTYDPFTGGYLNASKTVTVKKNAKWNVSLKK